MFSDKTAKETELTQAETSLRNEAESTEKFIVRVLNERAPWEGRNRQLELESGEWKLKLAQRELTIDMIVDATTYVEAERDGQKLNVVFLPHGRVVADVNGTTVLDQRGSDKASPEVLRDVSYRLCELKDVAQAAL